MKENNSHKSKYSSHNPKIDIQSKLDYKLLKANIKRIITKVYAYLMKIIGEKPLNDKSNIFPLISTFSKPSKVFLHFEVEAP